MQSLSILLLLFVVFHPSSALPQKPNIVFVLVDDWGYQDVGYRGSNILTPNIDSLARTGVILDYHYVTPLCAPTRASLMTGRYPIRTGYWRGNPSIREEWGLGLNETTMPEMLARNGYSSHCVGKWHLGFFKPDLLPGNRGCETYYGFVGSPTQDHFNHTNERGYFDFRLQYHNKDGSFIDNMLYDAKGKYSCDLYTERSLDIIKSHNRSKPLFMYLAYSNVHAPIQVEKADFVKFTGHMGPELDFKRKSLAAMLSKVDEGIGKIVDQLKKEGLFDTTLLIVSTDNGGVLLRSTNFPLRSGKRHVLEGGVRSWALVNSPLLQRHGYTNTNLFHVVDWYPTFQHLAGDNPEAHHKKQLQIDGINIWETLNSNKHLSRDEILLSFSHPKYCHGCTSNASPDDVFALRWKKWKLIDTAASLHRRWGSENCVKKSKGGCGENILPYHGRLDTGRITLFDLESDPRETKNVHDLYPDVVETMMLRRSFYSQQTKPIFKIKSCRENCFVNNTVQPWRWT